jgi:hypothetical protein
MIVDSLGSRLLLAIATVTVVIFTGATLAQARPVKLIPSGHILAGLEYTEGVAVASNGNLYVSDRGHNRVQELRPDGELVLMFGKEVNQTTKGDICTEEEIVKSGVKCKAGVIGSGSGAFKEAQSLAIDPNTGNVYVQDLANWRVDEYTAGGQFLLMIGGEVDETTKSNVCTASSGDKCQAGVQSTSGNAAHGAFDFAQFSGDLLTVGKEGILYVGDDQRIQEFGEEGMWKKEIPLPTAEQVLALTLDAAGDMYLVYQAQPSIIHELNPAGLETGAITIRAKLQKNSMVIKALALDSESHLAVPALEEDEGTPISVSGSLVDAGTGKLVSRFGIPTESGGIAFNGQSELYLPASGSKSEVVVYKPVNIAELILRPASCIPGAENTANADVTLVCSLNGEVNQWGVPDTEVWFEWGRSEALGERTATQLIKEPPVEVPVPTSSEVPAVRPNEAGFYYRMAAFDENVPSTEEALNSEISSFTTPITLPRTIGEPRVQFIGAFSTVLIGELNPENANTNYEFQYGPCKENNVGKCAESAYTAEASTLSSAAYGKIGVTEEISGLEANTTYHYRLHAKSQNSLQTETQEATGSEGSFKTIPAPKVQATTEGTSAVTPTSANISGTVDPDGQPATYAFELGVNAGAGTQYGTVLTGPVEAAVNPIEESFALTGLQPGTTYAYRITISSGYGTAIGLTMSFSTLGLPSALPSPAAPPILTVPAFVFPKPEAPPKLAPKSKCKRGYVRGKGGKCVKQQKTVKSHKAGTRKKTK